MDRQTHTGTHQQKHHNHNHTREHPRQTVSQKLISLTLIHTDYNVTYRLHLSGKTSSANTRQVCLNYTIDVSDNTRWNSQSCENPANWTVGWRHHWICAWHNTPTHNDVMMSGNQTQLMCVHVRDTTHQKNTAVISIAPPTVWPMAHYRSQPTRVSQP